MILDNKNNGMLPSLSDDEIEDRYFLLGQMEILSVLNELIHRRTPVAVYFNGGRDLFMTTLLEARSEALIFDYSGDEKANRNITLSANCVFVANLDGIRVQCSSGPARSFSWGGSNAFWVPLPQRVVRIQRRESYRIQLPIAEPLMVALYTANDKLMGEWPTHDLSVGGLGFNALGMTNFKPLQHIARLVFQLPLQKRQAIDCPAVVRHVTALSDRQGSMRSRVGVSFSDLALTTAVAIQRYIIRVEHERRNLVRTQNET
ncbi:MAG: flagellar brake protein [Proteobacteria bacterium]|nr:flagellar brake protein [Pseudomonadota bacterium]